MFREKRVDREGIDKMFENNSFLRPDGSEIDLLIPFEQFFKVEIEGSNRSFI
jgi:hypothetical protein